jgi:hypothetical protein
MCFFNVFLSEKKRGLQKADACTARPPPGARDGRALRRRSAGAEGVEDKDREPIQTGAFWRERRPEARRGPSVVFV